MLTSRCSGIDVEATPLLLRSPRPATCVREKRNGR